MKLLSFLLTLLLAAQASAKAVFAHFMIGNTEHYTSGDFLNDIRLAQEAHIDGFVLNIANADPTNDRSIPMAFEAAASLGFKLLFSFDYAGHGDWPKDAVIGLLKQYGQHSAHFRRGSQPLVSTFEGFKSSGDWADIRAQTNCYFMPSWSSVGAKRAVRTNAVDGLFSWGAWPAGAKSTDMEIDASYLIFLDGASYMMPVSPWFYTNLPGYNKNWLWRGDSLLHERWNLVFSLVSQNQWVDQPEYLQIISWNDYGESHYIGPLNDKAYVAFDIGQAPYNYVKGYPHDAWRMLLPFAIDTYKTGHATITKEVLVSWYRLTPAAACGTGGTTGNTAAQVQEELPPGDLAQDKIFVSAVLGSPAILRVSVGGLTEIVKWDDVPYGNIGMYHGSYAYKGRTGGVTVELVDPASGAVIATLNGASLRTTCEQGITNWNPWVGGVQTSRGVNKKPLLSLADQTCMEGNGRAGFEELCKFACVQGYCPPGPCTCTKIGKPLLELPALDREGYPLPGADCTYKGLCSFACNYGPCPAAYCALDPAAKDKCVIPPEEPDPEDTIAGACTSGTGTGGLTGLCDFACGRGYCPEPQCTCTGRGPAITPPKETGLSGYPGQGVGAEYAPLCAFVCPRGYCPEGVCSNRPPTSGNGDGGWVVDTSDLSPGSDAYKTIACSHEGINDAKKDAEWRWNQVKATDLWDQLRWTWTWKELAGDKSTVAFPIWISDAVHGPEGMNCQSLVSANGCRTPKQCHDMASPAHYFVINSFVSLSNMIWNFYDSLNKGKTDISAEANKLAELFAPVARNDALPLAIIIDIVTLGYGAFAAPFWNSILKKQAYFAANPNTLGVLKDGTNSMVAGSLTLVKDVTAADARITTTNVLSDRISAIMEIWYETTDAFNKYIFSGGMASNRALNKLIVDGKLIDANSEMLSAEEVKKLAKRALYAMLIPTAWKISGRDLGPFVLDGRIACDQYLTSSIISRSVQDKTRVCVDGNAYFLVGASEPDKNCNGDGSGGGTCDGFLELPGSDQLKGQLWGQITVDDIVHGSVATFNKNGKTNGAPTIDPVNNDFLSNVQDVNVRAPGLISLPVCSNVQAERNWWNNYQGGKKPANYPCD